MSKIKTRWELQKYFYESVEDKKIRSEVKNCEKLISEFIKEYEKLVNKLD